MRAEPSASSAATFKRPTAVIPLVMSFAALSVVLGHIVIYGGARQADEGAAAHLWQLLMAGQIPVIAYFAIKWFPERDGKRYSYSWCRWSPPSQRPPPFLSSDFRVTARAGVVG